MKKDGTQSINLKKITIARISADAMKKVEGGTSVLTSDQPDDGEIYGYCYNEK